MIEKKRYPLDELAERRILGTPRCGDKERNETADYLGDMFAQGYLKQPEFEARKDAALQAVTGNELRILRMDLPVSIESWRVRQHKVTVQPSAPKWRVLPSNVIVLIFGLIVLGTAVSGFFAEPGMGVTGLMIQMLIGLFLVASGFPEKR